MSDRLNKPRSPAQKGRLLTTTLMALLTLTVLVTTIDAQWDWVGDVGSARYDHKGFKLQQLVNFQKFSTLRVK